MRSTERPRRAGAPSSERPTDEEGRPMSSDRDGRGRWGSTVSGASASSPSGITWREVTSRAWWSTSVARSARAWRPSAGSIENDSTYGSIHRFLFGVDAAPCVQHRRPRDAACSRSPACRSRCSRTARNPSDIDWRRHERAARGRHHRVPSTTRRRAVDSPRGSLRGHLLARGGEGASTAPPSSCAGPSRPVDAGGRDHADLRHQPRGLRSPRAIDLISAASCTTTALAHMVKPLLEQLRGRRAS